MRKLWVAALALVIVAGCGGQSANDKSREEAQKHARNFTYYVPHNEVEQKNMDRRARLADDPSTILWCTIFPPGVQGVKSSTGGQAFTIAVVGKLTSSGKRPFRAVNNNGYENPDQNGVYGSSVEYRFGFDPTGARYHEVTSMASYCTNVPLVWQTQETRLAVAVDTSLDKLSKAAQELLRAAARAEKRKDKVEAAKLREQAGRLLSGAKG